MTRFESIQTDPPRDRAVFPNTPISPLSIPKDAVESAPSSDQELRNAEARTVSTSRRDDDEYSDENIAKWLERDRLDPDIEPWVRATLGE